MLSSEFCRGGRSGAPPTPALLRQAHKRRACLATLAARLVKATKEPDQHQNRDRNAEQPKQQISSHRRFSSRLKGNTPGRARFRWAYRHIGWAFDGNKNTRSRIVTSYGARVIRVIRALPTMLESENESKSEPEPEARPTAAGRSAGWRTAETRPAAAGWSPAGWSAEPLTLLDRETLKPRREAGFSFFPVGCWPRKHAHICLWDEHGVVAAAVSLVRRSARRLRF